MHDAKYGFARGLRLPPETFYSVNRQPHRLLQDHVAARSNRFSGKIDVRTVRRTDRNHIDADVLKRFAQTGKGARFRGPIAGRDVALDPLVFPQHIRHSHKLGFSVTAHHRGVALSNVATSHHRNSDRSVHAAKVADYLRTMRVVSLVPSWTEFLHELGVEVVGQTKFCVRPEAAFRTVPRVGGTKTANVQAVLDLQPDLVVANREENDREQIELLQQALGRDAVLVTDVRTVDQALASMTDLGFRVGHESEGRAWSERIAEAWGPPRPARGDAGYAVWSSPWMVAGKDTYISDVMKHWGIRNAIEDLAAPDRYPTLGESPTDSARCARTWLLPSEPFPFGEKHVAALHVECPQARCKLVDGEAFSWYGSRMLHVVNHLRTVSEWVAD